MSRFAKAAALTVTAGAALAATTGIAAADSGANGAAANSPGVASGNLIQVPVHIPINVCGNTIDVIAALNPTFGNTCANVDVIKQEEHHKHQEHHNNNHHQQQHHR